MIKIRKILLIIVIILLENMIVRPVFAETQVAIMEGKDNIFKEGSISSFYDICRNMTKEGGSLHRCDVVSHMATNEDWAAVSYLANSIYGILGAKISPSDTEKSKGIEVVLNDITYLSTNGNATGVMNFGYTSTFTAGIVSDENGYVDTTSKEAQMYGTSLVNEYNSDSNSKLVTKVSDTVDCKNKMAMHNWYGEYEYTAYTFINDLGYSNTRLFGYRKDIFNCIWGNYYSGKRNLWPLWSQLDGSNYHKSTTFRVAVWN